METRSESVREVRKILTPLDLRFVVTDHVLPCQPEGHKREMKKLVSDTIMASYTSPAKDAREKAGKKPVHF
jgi:hypothetical protein